MVPRLIAAVALAIGAGTAHFYAGAGLTLSHYDAKAHLVVARRIVDSLTPGWVQIGAVWLPLPHLINVIPTQVDVFYRTGAFAVGLSVVCFAATVFIASRLVLAATGSVLAAIVSATVLLLNPNLLYLQSTPMTEPLLLLLSIASVWLAMQAVESDNAADARRAGTVMFAACLTRYEAWPISAALVVLALIARLLRRQPLRDVLARTATLAAYPLAAAAAFALLSRVAVGEWLVQGGFFVPDNVAAGRPLRSLVSVWWGVHQLVGYPLLLLACAGILALFVAIARKRGRAAHVIPLALIGAAVLPWYAFLEAHPFRIRYMVPMIPVVALGVGYAVGLGGRRVGLAVAALACGALALGPRPLDQTASMVREAQWDSPSRVGRSAVTRYLRAHWDGQPVMVSMGSLAHYLQELSHAGFDLRDFLHEGNGDLWTAALEDPAPHVRWILVEERAEGGDLLAARGRQRPGFLGGYERVADGGGVALYRRREPDAPHGIRSWPIPQNR